jgi:hypothetical protein
MFSSRPISWSIKEGDQSVRYVLVFLFLYSFREFFVYFLLNVHVYIRAFDLQMNTSSIHNMVYRVSFLMTSCTPLLFWTIFCCYLSFDWIDRRRWDCIDCRRRVSPYWHCRPPSSLHRAAAVARSSVRSHQCLLLQLDQIKIVSICCRHRAIFV